MLSPSLTTTTSAARAKDITHNEENALRYISGYIISKLKKKVSASKHSLKKELLIGLGDFVEYNASVSSCPSAE